MALRITLLTFLFVPASMLANSNSLNSVGFFFGPGTTFTLKEQPGSDYWSKYPEPGFFLGIEYSRNLSKRVELTGSIFYTLEKFNMEFDWTNYPWPSLNNREQSTKEQLISIGLAPKINFGEKQILFTRVGLYGSSRLSYEVILPPPYDEKLRIRPNWETARENRIGILAGIGANLYFHPKFEGIIEARSNLPFGHWNQYYGGVWDIEDMSLFILFGISYNF